MHYCCVPTCRNTSKASKMHRFPKDSQLCKQWLEKIANNKLMQKDFQTLRTGYRVCDIHFSQDCRIPGRHGADILATSIPTLHIPSPELLSTEPLASVPSEQSESIVASFSELSSEPESGEGIITSTPSTSAGVSSTPKFCKELSIETLASVSSEQLESIQPSFPQYSSEVEMGERVVTPTPSTTAHMPHTPKFRKDLRRRVQLLRSVNVASAHELTPKARKLYKMARAFRFTAKKLDFECGDVRKRFKKAQKFMESPEFMQAKVNKITYNFIISQLHNQPVSMKARRYTLDDKILSLCLWKQSPKGYKLLRKLFALPSKKTVMSLLKKIPFETGINESLLNLLKESVSSLDSLDKYCVILFDEMAIEPSLLYNPGKDIIEGFQDNGNAERKALFADKVMVFMARGIHKKWKQPIAYYFNEGGMKKDLVKTSIKDVVRAAKSVGLKVIGTVCDQGTANVAAIQSMYRDTEAAYKKLQCENRNFGFEIDGEEIVPIYDPPYLLKVQFARHESHNIN